MTPLVAPPVAADVDDGPAIAELHRLHAVQRTAFLADPYPAADERARSCLARSAGMVLGHRDQIRAAMSEDFGAHPDLFTDLVEVLGVAGRAAYAIEQLDSWLAEDERYADPALYGTARAGVRYQPKGVVGNIVPWNFPFDLSRRAAGRDARRGQPGDHQAVGLHAGLRRAAARRWCRQTFGEDRVAVVGRRPDPGQGVPDRCAGTTCCTPAARRSAARSPRPPPRTWSRSPWSWAASARPSWPPDSVDAEPACAA